MKKLINTWEELWNENFSSLGSSERNFRLLNDILEEIGKEDDEVFIKEVLSLSRSINIVIKKLYFEYAPIEKLPHENPHLISPKDLPDIDVNNSEVFQKNLDSEYLDALKHNELQTKICKNCSGVDNFIEDDYFGKPIVVCIENGCLKQYSYSKVSNNQYKVPLHWIGLKYTFYERKFKKGFKEWVKTQIDPLRHSDDLEETEYNYFGKKIDYYWENLEAKTENDISKSSENFANEIDVFSKGEPWYYWVLGFKSFRLHKEHQNRDFDQEEGCNKNICKMDL